MSFGRTPLALTALAASLALAALAAAPAAAEEVHVSTQTLTGFAGNPFNEPLAAAVDNSTGPHAGDVYILDNGARRVVALTAAGAFRTSWGTNVNEGTGDPNICSSAGAPENICKTGEFSFATAPYQIANAFSIAVDSTSGSSQGDVYVAANSLIVKYDPSGHVVTSFGGSPFPGGIQVSGFNNPSIAIDSSGDLYSLVANQLTKYSENGALLSTLTLPFSASTGGSRGSLALEPSGDFFVEAEGEFGSPGVVKKVSSTGVELGQVTLAGGQNHGLAFDPGADELLAARQEYPLESVRAFRFNGSDEVLQSGGGACALSASGCAATEEFANEGELNGVAGLAVNTANHTLYVVDTNNHVVRAYRLINLPKLTTGGTESLTRTSVKFLGHVDPDGAGQVTTCKFEYGTTKSYELGSVPCTPATTSVASDVVAELPVGTLTAATTYHYRLVVGNANGERPGPDQTFTTPPAVAGVTTGQPISVGKLEASVKGSFTGDGVDTSYYFEYGPTTAYGQRTPDVDLGTASGVQNVAATLTQLTPYTTYHYRLVAHNMYGITPGADETLFTPAPDPPTVERTYVSAVDQDSATVNAEVNLGEGRTVYRFEYGVSASYGSLTLVGVPLDPETPDRIASAELTELLPGTTYHFRVLATNFTSTTAGPDQTFTTPSVPVIISASASAIAETSATLNAVVNPSLSPTTYHFEYGPSSSYGSRTPESAPIGDDTAAHAVSAPIAGLAPGTVYHFRLVAGNGVGVTPGPDQTFTTSSPPSGNGGGGTPKQCKKGFVKKHGKCVRKPHKPYKKHRTKKHKHG